MVKSELKLITKESESNELNIKSVALKIKELKKEFRSRTYNHIGNLYKILSSIVRLKQSIDPKYKIRSLEWEEDLKLTAMQIRYIFSYEHISTYAEKKVKEGLITDTAICHFLAVSSLLRESQWQNKLIDKIIEEKMKVSEVSELTKPELKLYLTEKLKVRKDDKYFLSATKSLRSMFTRIKDRKNLIGKSPYSDNLINAIRKLNKLIDDVSLGVNE